MSTFGGAYSHLFNKRGGWNKRVDLIIGCVGEFFSKNSKICCLIIR